ncbi:MAG: NFACT family protein, partial [Myxococcota bacterium]|nr:NFACT family protein [Myxococcota bacterium]
MERLGSQLTGRYLDRLWRTDPDELLIRFAGEKRRLLIHVGLQLVTLGWVDRWPPTPSSPDYETIQLRTHLEGGRIASVALVDDRRLVLSLTRGDGPRQLSVQLAGRYPNVAVFALETQLGVALRQDRPAADEDSPPLFEGEALLAEVQADAWLEAHGDLTISTLEAATLERARGELARMARGWRKRAQRAVDAVSRDLARAEGAEQDRFHGELLKGALGRIQKGATSVQLVDYTHTDGPLVDIPLEPALDPVENMQRYFRRYRKYRQARDTIAARLGQLTERLARADAILADIASAESTQGLDDARTALRTAGWRPRRRQATQRKAAEPPLPYRRFVSVDGADILVGRGARFNDALTFGVARGRDLWFHARDSPGAHVFLRGPRSG